MWRISFWCVHRHNANRCGKRKRPETESPSIAELELSVNRFSSEWEGNGKEGNQWRHIFTAVKRSLNSSSSNERLRNGIIDIMPWCFRDGSCPQTIQSNSKWFRRIFSDPVVLRSISDTKFGNWWMRGKKMGKILKTLCVGKWPWVAWDISELIKFFFLFLLEVNTKMDEIHF